MNLHASVLRRLLSKRNNRDTEIIAASGLFDTSYYYLNGGEDVASAGVDPIQHFCDHGWLEGRRPNLFFDPLWYADRYLVAGPEENPHAHYIRVGEAAGGSRSAFSITPGIETQTTCKSRVHRSLIISQTGGRSVFTHRRL